GENFADYLDKALHLQDVNVDLLNSNVKFDYKNIDNINMLANNKMEFNLQDKSESDNNKYLHMLGITIATTAKSIKNAITKDSKNKKNVAENKVPDRPIEKVDKTQKVKKLDNKLNHIFNKKEHKLDDFLNKFQNNQQAYNATIKELEKDMANGKLPNNFTSGHKVNIKGYEITVRGVIKDGKPEIGTMFIP
ncbi:hypothetical protein, partial [Campylobacter majalis]|uniref:hypothetical protein n=1 Tax=Campylobacter majalis TaxID=2790656 RepID=UPI003D693B76